MVARIPIRLAASSSCVSKLMTAATRPHGTLFRGNCRWPPLRCRLADHLVALGRSGNALRAAAAAAGLDAKVPTCPAWDVTKLVVHQGMVHRWAAANLRGDTAHDTSASKAEAAAAADLLAWYSAGL